MSRPFATSLDAFAEELERVLDVLEELPADAPVPTCPGWDATALAEHLGLVYGRWRQRLAAEGAEGAEGAAPPAPGEGAGGAGTHERRGLSEAARAAYEEGVALHGELAAAGEEAPCWNWTGTDQTAGFLARRIALETAIHRVDAERCGSRALPVEAELAVDGIEEQLEVHLPTALRRNPKASLAGTVCLVCSDLDAAFVVELQAGRLRWRRGRGPADAALVGTASELFLFTWNRLPLEQLSLTGSHDVAAAWRGLSA